MLVLGRKIGETIFIGDDVTVTVTGYRNGLVKLAINAPHNVSVHREEIYNRIQAEKEKDGNF